MTTFDERENAFEAKFALDSELRLEAEARRNKFIGLWAADLLGIVGEKQRNTRLMSSDQTLKNLAMKMCFEN